MHSKAPALQDDQALQATATRLVEALGVEDAIFVCRSNYWYGVLRLIVDRQAGDLDRAHEVRDEHSQAPTLGYKLAA